MSEKFWMVIRDTGGAPPSKRHLNHDEAVKEAGRLARQSGEKYYILQAVGYCEQPVQPVAYIPLDDHD